MTEQEITQMSQRSSRAEDNKPLPKPKFNWDFDAYNGELKLALDQTRRFARAIQAGKKPYWLTLAGNSGTGKSHLARKTAKALKSIHRQHTYFRWITALKLMRAGDYGVFDFLADTKILILDDIFAGFETELAISKLYEVLEYRQNKWTFITSNKLLDDIREHEARIASRMLRHGSVVVQITKTQDFNQK